MRLGIDSFSVRWQGWDAFQLLDYAARLGLDNVHFSERAHLGDLGSTFLRKVRQYAEDRDLSIEIGMRSFNKYSTTFVPALGTGEQQLSDMIQAATVIGSQIVRCFVGTQSDRAAVSVDQLMEESTRTLKSVATRAEAADVTIAVENHGGVDLLATELREIIEAVGSSHVRVCLDTGNPVYAAEDAVSATEVLAPYTVSTHLRDTLAWLTPAGAMVQWAPVGRGSVDLKQIISILRDHAPDATIDLEIITGVGPKEIAIFDPCSDYWAMYPDRKAIELVHFLAFAAAGRSEPLDQLELATGVWQPPAEQIEAFRQQQLQHLEESVVYCRDVLGLQQGASG